jgi:hypothetical protein
MGVPRRQPGNCSFRPPASQDYQEPGTLPSGDAVVKLLWLGIFLGIAVALAAAIGLFVGLLLLRKPHLDVEALLSPGATGTIQRLVDGRY